MKYDLVVIGAGAGGCFAAIRLAELYPGASICILEAARKPLGKVEISGGGRCNVTHACYDPQELVKNYPRGQKELLQPFTRFQPKDLVAWFEKKGIRIKREADGRMFPATDSSATIISCFLRSMATYGIELLTSSRAVDWGRDASTGLWNIQTQDGRRLESAFLLLSSGSDQRSWQMLKAMGHTIIDPVPSLFTFNIPEKPLTVLSGLSKEMVSVSIPAFHLEATGPILITHWGMSGPAILRLSAWGARELHHCGYVFDLEVNWLYPMKQEVVKERLMSLCLLHPKKQIHNIGYDDIPARLWKYLCMRSGIPGKVNGSEVGNKKIEILAAALTQDTYRVTGKSTYKDEFVTAGGVDLAEIDFTRFESKLIRGLFLVGEVLNIDAITGGFNFQAAWTGAEIVASSISELKSVRK